MKTILKSTLVLFTTLSLLNWACQSKSTNSQNTGEEMSTAPQPSIAEVWSSDTTLITPESVIYYSEDNILYVSCIGAVPPDAKDGDGYIAKVSPEDGSVIDPMWVAGLDAPKGLGITDGKLFVTDIDQVVAIDIATGEIVAKYPVEGATFLNDIDISSEGDVFITDSGTDKLHLLKDGTVTTILNESAFGRPNGLLHLGSSLYMSTSRSGNFYKINTADWSYSIVTDSIFGGDGVELVGSDYLVSSWMGEIYYVKDDGDKTLLLDTKETANAADIDFVAATNMIYVPTFFGNQVVAYKLSK